MNTFRKIPVLLTLIVFGVLGKGFCQTYPEWELQKKGEFQISRDITLNNSITLTGNLTLHIVGNGHMIKRNFDGNDLFNIIGESSSKIYKLTIIGEGTDTLFLDGGAVFNIPYDARSGIKSGAGSKEGRCIEIGDWGALELQNVVIQNFYGRTSTNGAGIYCNNNRGTRTTVTLTDCVIRGCFARLEASAIHCDEGCNIEFKLLRTKVSHNYANAVLISGSGGGGTVRCEGGARSSMEIDSCEICYNTSEWHGGGVSWFGGAGGTDATGLLVKGHTKIHDNVSGVVGGGIFCGSNGVIESAEIYANKATGTTDNDKYARGCGGGIYVMTYRGPERTYDGRGVKFTIMPDVSIHDNEAAVGGGGICVDFFPSNFLGFNSSNNPIDTLKAKCSVTIKDGSQIYGNSASVGGGLYIMDALPYRYQNTESELWSKEYKREVIVEGGEIKNNYTKTTTNSNVDFYGGGVYIYKYKLSNVNYSASQSSARGAGTLNVHIKGGKIHGNYAHSDSGHGYGGGVCINDSFTKNKSICNVTIGGSAEIYDNWCDKDGGGLRIMSAKESGDGKLSVKVNGGAIGKENQPNKALGGNGGGVSVTGGNLFVDGGVIDYNEAKVSGNNGGKGGAFSVEGGYAVISGGSVSYNKADVAGGAFFLDADGAVFDTIQNGAEISNNEAVNGGGVYVDDGSLRVLDATTCISNNKATASGGGIYVGGGDIIVSGAKISGNKADNGQGGGIYAGNGNIFVKDEAQIGFYSGGGSANTAKEGGGLYVNSGNVVFTNGTFAENYASEKGGGIYLKEGATLTMTGNATLTLNHVPTDGEGGGVYLDGTFNVGDGTTGHTLKIEDNYAGTPTVLNNVFLPHDDDVITLLSDISGKDMYDHYLTHIGFSVNRGFRKVVYSTTEPWLKALMGTTSTLVSAVFDDAAKYIAVHLTDDRPPFEKEYIYLWGCWTTAVTSDPGTAHIELVGDTFHIKSNQGLAWFTSLVNGLNHRPDDATSNPYSDPQTTLKAVMESDVNMEDYLWVPIGGVGSYEGFDPSDMSSIFTPGGEYKGVFDGQGHIISGLDCRYITSIQSYGLFGNMTGGEVRNTFVKDYDFVTEDNSIDYRIGGITGHMSAGSLRCCEAQGVVTASTCGGNTAVGGLVGLAEATATIHSSLAQPIIAQGKASIAIGGLVGKLDGTANVKNSFANPRLGTVSGNVGGLVGTNAGTVENCYVRLQHATAPTNFYWFAAVNNGTVDCCYARNDATSDHYTTGTAATGSGTYGITQLPYLYKHRDTQVEATNPYVSTDADADNQMMNVLNNWVNHPDQASGNYTKWGRPWQESDAQKPLNGDYPILKMPMGEAVAAKASDPYLYYNPVDSLLVRCTDAESAIWVYRNPSDTVRGDNSTSAAKLYIAEDVVLLNDNPLKAYVGITLDNSAGANGAHPTYGSVVGVETDETDWHMIATPLSDAPIGINYTDGDAYDFAWGHPDGMPYYRFYPKDDVKHGYFPSHRFGESYPSTDATIEAGNYYNEWDFYSYSEPNCHWINFKRNSASHHHFDTESHDAITYGNESIMVPGRGYFAATREETFLQCQGHLNNGAVAYNLTQTSGVPRHGYNLIGNPYQTYLNFDAFADANSGAGDNKIWAAASNASYTILDEDELETSINVETIMGQKPVFYRTYSYRCSSNPDVSAGGFIHPHQGFFVRLEGDKESAQAQFAPDQRNVTAKSKFRGDVHVDYPLVNLFAIEEDGAADVVTVELGRPDEGGAPLMQSLRVGNGKIWCHYDDKDYAIAYTQPGITEVGIRFETVKDTEYTMRWSTRNGEFSYLHLIDNKTGADVDCLSTSEYKFSARKSDYKSRFRLVFDYTGVGEGTEAAAGQDFAFMMNGELVVTGEGVLQVFDVTGRLVTSQELHGVQTTVSLPAAANGVYVLRLTEGKQSRIQKMVISK